MLLFTLYLVVVNFMLVVQRLRLVFSLLFITVQHSLLG